MLRDPYRYIGLQCERLGSSVIETRVLLQPTVCMKGPTCAELFYDMQRFTRIGAAPEPVQATLFGKGGVQGLEGPAHRYRKAMFISALAASRVELLAQEVVRSWSEAINEWREQRSIVLYPAVQRLLTRAVCRWAGVLLAPNELPTRTAQLVSLFDDAGSARHFRSRRARAEAEQWCSGLIEDVRSRRVDLAEESALAVVARQTDENGALLPLRIAAVEMLNLLRPTVAASVFVVFAAHALHRFASCRAPIAAGESRELEWFVQEVRRYYPFFPAVAARVREPFVWEGFKFQKDRLVLLDLYGTNHDPVAWRDPGAFRPSRFADEKITAFNLVPQGGGDVRVHHRCPGEGAVVAVMKVSADFLARRIRYEMPQQDLDIAWRRLPAIPRSGVVIAGVAPT
ncbi:MAG: cytochrome P450 [Methylibium petroleiphilum]|nr:cytochrome P450 [Methylibium petroleiphilum]